MFCFVNYRRVKDKFPVSDEEEFYFEPDLPEEFDYSELLSFVESNIGLFEINISNDDISQNYRIEQVSEEFETLLHSAKDFPPALAMMRLQLRKENVTTKNEIQFAAQKILINFLENQRKSPFFLAKSIETDDIERRRNGYQWIVGYSEYNKQIKVKWIAWDYHIYEAPIEHFDIDLIELENRFGKLN